MADSIQFKRGKKETLPQLPDGTPGWCSDTGELFVGSPAGNRKVGGDIQEELNRLKGAVSALSPLDTEAALSDVIAVCNSLLVCFGTAEE